MTTPPIITPIAWFRRRDYARHRALDHTLPETFEVWQHRAEAIEQDSQARGHTVARVFLDPDDLVVWCQGRRRGIDAHARAELAAHRFADHQARSGQGQD